MPITSADATVAIVDGRLAMNADGDVDVYLDTPDQTPLTRTEPHATLRFEGDDYRAALELDADQLAALQEALSADGGDA
ncbi:hypothetical protein [Halarchaeum nitratireducens]|uniref:Uncharacterized protein n=1 Tax=Halarchaeum nitratireducens TaxID=489913 RepID=A0A830GEN0_9EURY|nr:hypothetical protein [Halarchaeum nitratireducens]GGN26990.1 hypothetical protein GCM10009021_31880 [Halarchaeum nitratireducens]